VGPMKEPRTARSAMAGLNRPDSPLPPLCCCWCRVKEPDKDGHLSEQRMRTRQRCKSPLSAPTVYDAARVSASSPTTTPEAATKGAGRAQQGGRRSSCAMNEYEWSDGLILPMKPRTT
jgi:hypothetical protein